MQRDAERAADLRAATRTTGCPERPYLDRVEVSIIPDPNALLNALKSGQIAAARELGYRDAENLGKSGGFTVHDLEGAELQAYVGVNVTEPSLADVRVRQAIAFSLDRERIINEVFRGAGYPLNVPWPKNSPAFDESRNAKYKRDIDKAKQLLGQAAKPPKLPLTFAPGYGEASPRSCRPTSPTSASRSSSTRSSTPPSSSSSSAQQFRGLWVTDHSWAQYVPSTLTVSAYPFNARQQCLALRITGLHRGRRRGMAAGAGHRRPMRCAPTRPSPTSCWKGCS